MYVSDDSMNIHPVDLIASAIRRPRVLLIFTGSVATVKIPQLFVQLQDFADVLILASSFASVFFLEKASDYNNEAWCKFKEAGGLQSIVANEREWEWGRMGDPVFHIELRKWADLILVAPLSADFLGKISGGLADSLALSVLRAWDVRSDPCVLCPAMNTLMWLHPATDEALVKLTGWGYQVVKPVKKELACKDVGVGAMADVATIVSFVKDLCTSIKVNKNNCTHEKSYFVSKGENKLRGWDRLDRYVLQNRSPLLLAAITVLALSAVLRYKRL